jgi:hypothetical protein
VTDALDRVRRLCLALPEAGEQEAWGEPTFRVRKRIFAMYATAANHHGGGRAAVWCKAPLGVQEHLVRTQPGVYFVPPYVGVKGWIGIRLDTVDDVDLRGHIVDSFCLVAPRRLAARVE